MNNIILFDIDGTLSTNGIIPESAKRTLRELRLNGNIVMLATGRSLGMLKDILSEVEVDGAILNNGAYAILDNKEIYSSPIDKKIIEKMLIDKLNVAALLKNAFVSFKADKVFKVFCDYFKIDLPKLTDISILDNNPAYSLGVYAFEPDLINQEKYGLKFVKVNKWGFDVMNKGISKASPFNSLKELYKGYKIIAFGDNYNDLEMLMEADISVAMGSAPDDIKRVASYVTKNCLEDGIEYAVKELIKLI